MTEPQKFQLMKSKRDAALDLASLGAFCVMAYFVMNPEKYDRMTDSVSARFHAVEHWLSVLTTKLAIRSLPETDDDK